LGSLNSFGDSTTTPPSSQEHTGSGGSNTGGSGTSVQQRETLHSRFEFKQTLGKGTYGKVKLALDKRKNEQVAIKTIKKSRIENPHDLARIRREIDFMTSLNHPYIIKIKEGIKLNCELFLFKSIRILVYESREKIILVMEYASGGELYDYLNRMKRIPESQARAIFRQIVSAVHFLHKVNKPMN
jgi:NUAK family SNF1-like kinase